MTFDEYINNPIGNKSFVMTNRKVYKDLYTNKWDALMVRENGNNTYTLYIKDNIYYIHMKIPSEVVPKFYYDVIVKFYLPKDKLSNTSDKSLKKYEVQFYSNDPNFVFTFAHAFRKHNMLIEDLEPKMSKLALKEKPRERNPNDDTGYVKSLYFLYLAIDNLKLFDKSKWEGIYKPYNKNVWNNTVTHADDKIRDRQEQGAALSKKEKREENTKKNEDQGKSSTGITHKFGSPNIKGFGHFNKTLPNPLTKIATKLNHNFGHFKKNIK